MFVYYIFVCILLITVLVEASRAAIVCTIYVDFEVECDNLFS